MKNAVASTMSTLPELMRRSLTWDRGKELSAHAQFKVRPASRCSSPTRRVPLATRHEREHQRPAAPVLPEGHRPVRWSAQDLAAVAATLNNRPREALGWRTPAEVFNEHLQSPQQAGVATID